MPCTTHVHQFGCNLLSYFSIEKKCMLFGVIQNVYPLTCFTINGRTDSTEFWRQVGWSLIHVTFVYWLQQVQVSPQCSSCNCSILNTSIFLARTSIPLSTKQMYGWMVLHRESTPWRTKIHLTAQKWPYHLSAVPCHFTEQNGLRQTSKDGNLQT